MSPLVESISETALSEMALLKVMTTEAFLAMLSAASAGTIEDRATAETDPGVQEYAAGAAPTFFRSMSTAEASPALPDPSELTTIETSPDSPTPVRMLK